MNRLVNGECVESRAVVESYPSGAIANQASHQAIFSKNLLAEGGTVDLLTPDGKRLRAVPVGLGWKNARTGQFAWIARAKDTEGAIQSPATVVYENAKVYYNGAYRHDTNRTYWVGEVPSTVGQSKDTYFRLGIRLKE